MSRLKVSYRSNPCYVEDDESTAKHFATFDLAGFGVKGTRVVALPIHFRRLDRPVGPIREVYSSCVAGLPLEKGNLQSLESTLELYLGALIHFGRLPEYLFQLGDRAWPIYQLPDQLVTRYPGSPFFSASNIAELRVVLADYFKLSGQIRNRKELSVLYLSRSDLQLYPAVCTFRAHTLADVPVFPLPNGSHQHLIAPVNGRSITADLDDGVGILSLYQQVSKRLVQAGQLANSDGMSIRKLSAATWTALRQRLQEHDRSLAYYAELDGRLVRQVLPLSMNSDTMIAARTNHLGHTSLYLAPDIWRLQEILGQELYDEGKLSSPNYVTITKSEP